MSEGAKLLLIVFTMVFTENYVLVQFVAICPFLGVSQKFDTSFLHVFRLVLYQKIQNKH